MSRGAGDLESTGNGVDLDWTHLLPLPHTRTRSRTTSSPTSSGKIPRRREEVEEQRAPDPPATLVLRRQILKSPVCTCSNHREIHLRRPEKSSMWVMSNKSAKWSSWDPRNGRRRQSSDRDLTMFGAHTPAPAPLSPWGSPVAARGGARIASESSMRVLSNKSAKWSSWDLRNGRRRQSSDRDLTSVRCAPPTPLSPRGSPAAARGGARIASESPVPCAREKP
jgi:hypothetical protein